MSNTNTTELSAIANTDLDTVTGGTGSGSADLTSQLSSLKSSVDGIASSQANNNNSSSNNMMLPLMMMAMRPQQAAPTVVAAGGAPVVAAPAGGPVINVSTRFGRRC